jgi:hypothetical protein
LESNELHPVGERSLPAGIVLAEWFAHEARRVYLTLRETAAERDQRRLREWIASRGGSVSVRELQRANSRRWPTRESAQEELEALVHQGLGRWRDVPPGPSGGHPQQLFCLHASTHDTTDTRSAEESESSDTRADTCGPVENGHPDKNVGTIFKLKAYGGSAPADGGRLSVVSGAEAENGNDYGSEGRGECRTQLSDECRTPFEDEGEVEG